MQIPSRLEPEHKARVVQVPKSTRVFQQFSKLMADAVIWDNSPTITFVLLEDISGKPSANDE